MERCEVKRAAFHSFINPLPKERLYYIDQCGIDTHIYREYSYAKRGIKVFGSISGKKFKRTNIVASKCESNIVVPMVYDGTTDSILFEHWFEHALLKAIPKARTLFWIICTRKKLGARSAVLRSKTTELHSAEKASFTH